jgi:glycosyltransferase involved in cell wall biosynthesis
MRFKIVSTGWNCARFIEQTLASVAQQSVDNWDIWIIYDPSDDNGAQVVKDWCDARRQFGDDRWNYTINATRQFAVRNQYEAVHQLAPEPEDVVIWLDLDGDMFAHRDVLVHLANYYNEPDAPLVTYGSYRAVPDHGTSPPAVPFPDDVVRNNAYRQQMITGICCFNHLRTMKGKIVNAIPQNQFLFRGTENAGQWYTTAGDYIFMACALELAGGRYKVIEEVLLLYNHDNPYADYLMNSVASFATTNDYLYRPALTPLVDP